MSAPPTPTPTKATFVVEEDKGEKGDDHEDGDTTDPPSPEMYGAQDPRTRLPSRDVGRGAGAHNDVEMVRRLEHGERFLRLPTLWRMLGMGGVGGRKRKRKRAPRFGTRGAWCKYGKYQAG